MLQGSESVLHGAVHCTLVQKAAGRPHSAQSKPLSVLMPSCTHLTMKQVGREWALGKQVDFEHKVSPSATKPSDPYVT